MYRKNKKSNNIIQLFSMAGFVIKLTLLVLTKGIEAANWSDLD